MRSIAQMPPRTSRSRRLRGEPADASAQCSANYPAWRNFTTKIDVAPEFDPGPGRDVRGALGRRLPADRRRPADAVVAGHSPRLTRRHRPKRHATEHPHWANPPYAAPPEVDLDTAPG